MTIPRDDTVSTRIFLQIEALVVIEGMTAVRKHPHRVRCGSRVIGRMTRSASRHSTASRRATSRRRLSARMKTPVVPEEHLERADFAEKDLVMTAVQDVEVVRDAELVETLAHREVRGK